MVMRLLLDTNAFSAMMRGEPMVQNWIRTAEKIIVPYTVLGELLYGFACGNRKDENIVLLQRFLKHPLVSTTGQDMEVCEVYSRIGKQLREQGTPIPSNDHWIAATALRHNLTLVTRDRHFSYLPGLALLSWTHD
jgi:tRNA(fMet)-specific endonuclease VapC